VHAVARRERRGQEHAHQIITGAHQPDAGEIVVAGNVAGLTPARAQSWASPVFTSKPALLPT